MKRSSRDCMKTQMAETVPGARAKSRPEKGANGRVTQVQRSPKCGRSPQFSARYKQEREMMQEEHHTVKWV